MGATLAELENRGLVTRRPDPGDGRRILLSISAAGRRELNRRRNAVGVFGASIALAALAAFASLARGRVEC